MNSQALAPSIGSKGVITAEQHLGFSHLEGIWACNTFYRKKEAGRFLDGFWNMKKTGSIFETGTVVQYNGRRSGTIALNNKWHSWGLTTVLEKFAVETLSNLNTKCFSGECDRSINVWISGAYQCGMRSKKLCSVGWGESSSFIKHLSSGQLHYHNTELLYHETNILAQKDSLVDRLGILCIVCKFCLYTTAGFKQGER